MIRALIFDFNGVLADDDPIHMRAFRQVAQEEGFTFTEEEYLDTFLPLNDWDCFKTLFADRGATLAQERLEDLIRRKGVYYFQAIAEKSVLFDGAAAAIRAAAAHGPIAIASGARRQEIRHILSQANLLEQFAAIVAAEDVRFGKPHPEPFLQAHERLRERDQALTISECAAIEDSIGGIESAHQAGMRCLAVAQSYGPERLREAKPEWIIESIRDFKDWLKEVSK